MRLRRCVALAAVLMAAAASAQTIYTWVDDEGVQQFTDNQSNIPDKFKKKAKVTEGEELGTISHSSDDAEETAPVARPATVPSRPAPDGPSKCAPMKKQISDLEFDLAQKKTQYEARKKYCEQASASRVNRLGQVVPNSNCTEINGPPAMKAKLEAQERQLETLKDQLRVLQHQGC